MSVLSFSSSMPCTQQQLWEFHGSSDALRSLNPPGVSLALSGEMRVIEGAKLTVVSKFLFVRQVWEVELSCVENPKGFRDRAIRSPFIRWEHHHEFLEEGSQSRLRDTIQFEAKGGPLGIFCSVVFIRLLFAFRHWQTFRLVKRIS